MLASQFSCTEWATGVDTVTDAAAVLVVSAALVAVTVYVPAVLGAVYNPLLLMLPPLALHVTAVFVVPLTLAVNCCVPPVVTDAETGEMLTLTVAAGALTVTVALADLLLSATLVAVTV